MYRRRRHLGGILVVLFCGVLTGCSATVAGTGIAGPIPATTAAPVPLTVPTDQRLSAPTDPTSKARPSSAALSPQPTGGASTTSSTGPAHTQVDGGYVAPTECLMTVDDVTAAIPGEWNRQQGPEGSCAYSNDRGAMFAIAPIDYAPHELADALADARLHNCDTDPIDVPDTGGGFVCVEELDGKTSIEGNLVAGEHFWLFLIPGEGTHSPYSEETRALVALLGAAGR